MTDEYIFSSLRRVAQGEQPSCVCGKFRGIKLDARERERERESVLLNRRLGWKQRAVHHTCNAASTAAHTNEIVSLTSRFTLPPLVHNMQMFVI